MTTTATDNTHITLHDTPLDATERCDRCGAQAYVDLMMSSGSLLLCAHDFNKHEAVIVAQALLINDHRPALTKMEGGQRDAASST